MSRCDQIRDRMLVSIVDGFLVDLVVILSTAKPSELSSRLGAVPFRAILAIWFCLASWMVSRAQDGSNLDHQTGPKHSRVEKKTVKNQLQKRYFFESMLESIFH